MAKFLQKDKNPTNLILVNIQGITGKKIEYHSIRIAHSSF